MTFVRSPELFEPSRSRLLLIDLQERLMPVIDNHQQVTSKCRTLIQGAELLDVPVFLTEQYPKGLGKTIPQISELLPESDVPEKLRFSSAEALDWDGAAGTDRDQVVIAGIEGHVCVAQTVHDLLALGYRVQFVCDAISSRNPYDWKIAMKRLIASGAMPTTTEAILFEWCEVAGTDRFKALSKLITNPDA